MSDEISITNRMDIILPTEKTRDSKKKDLFKERLKKQGKKMEEDSKGINSMEDGEDDVTGEGTRPGKILDIIV